MCVPDDVASELDNSELIRGDVDLISEDARRRLGLIESFGEEPTNLCFHVSLTAGEVLGKDQAYNA